MSETYSVCFTCGKKVAFTECSDQRPLPDNPRCEALKGWFSISKWRGTECFDNYDFCSLDCLREWVEEQMPKIPEKLLKSLQNGLEEKDG